MNVFLRENIAKEYDDYYSTFAGLKIDEIEKKTISPFLERFPKNELLELGCGTGHWTEYLSGLGFQITAVDISEAMLKVAKEKNIKNAHFLKADALALPFENESFSSIVAITMLEFTGNFNQVLQEMNRVLQFGGELIIGCLNVDSEMGKIREQNEIFREAHFFSKEELVFLLSKIGEVTLHESVFLSHEFEILDGTMDEYPVEGAFLAARVKKQKY